MDINNLKKENLFKPDKIDFIFALIVFVLGYLFSRWVLFNWLGWGVSFFTLLYLLLTTTYLYKKKAFNHSFATWFWFAITLLTGGSYALWENVGIGGIRAIFLFCFAIYYIVIASGISILGKSSNFFPIDGINAAIVIPFNNFINQYVSFKVLKKDKNKKTGKKILPVLLGILVAIVLFIILIPLLERTDAGGFGVILNQLSGIIDFFRRLIFSEFLLYAFFALPVGAYLYGLVSGAAHKKKTDSFTPDSIGKTVAAMRVVQPVTVFIALGAVCVLYLVFIFSQIPYFFSAFTGVLPEGWLLYAEFARRGFFELVTIAVINLVLITIGNLTSKKARGESRALRLFNVILASITLVFIATAFSKMALYIDIFGLTMRRLLPSIFMVFLAIVFVALILLQNRSFSIVRFAFIAGSIMICVLCLSNPDALVVRYNTDRYLGGTLPEFDATVLWRSGIAGIPSALDIYEVTDDSGLRQEIRWYLQAHSRTHFVYNADNIYRLSFESYRVQGLPERRSP